ncbi:serine/threonine protein kinase KKIALRE [Cryptosporidium canis]|uniref:Serine/threonine protein kinase KKIALRE n=1 Tax=Cryptosporidium canis TaxID=195482 RepID=A0ABQ8PD59_9CRYT|nr:serine/threonine protein kinase KKIALRE [Cryptosporidium canis]KAJ1615104.1 serine/threonine protein kinase KKIALRE [Cryptosporidium canis]
MQGKCIHGLNRYKTICEIGEGAFGVVFKCRDLVTNEIVALKEFKMFWSDDTENSHLSKNSNNGGKRTNITHNKILREIATLRRLYGQKNIIQLKDFFLHENRYYLSLEYFPQTLLQYLEKSPKGLPLEIIKICIYQLLSALKKCHSMGIIHRDVKPENILVNDSKNMDLELKLCDFGFARFVNQNKSYSSQLKDSLSNSADNLCAASRPLTSYVSTRWYRAPELLVKSAEYGPGIDIWAVGCIMAELIDGEPLFPGTSDVDQLYLIRNTIGKLDDDNQVILESHKKLYDAYKKHIYNGFISGSNSRYNSEPSTSNSVIPPHQIMSIKERYGKKVDIIALDFLEKSLTIDPKKRPDCQELILHPFFSSINKIKNLFNSEQECTPSMLNKTSTSYKSFSLPVLTEICSNNSTKEDFCKSYEGSVDSNKLSEKLEQCQTKNKCALNDEKTTAPSTPDEISTPVSHCNIISSPKVWYEKVSLPKFPHIMPPPPPKSINQLKNGPNTRVKENIK